MDMDRPNLKNKPIELNSKSKIRCQSKETKPTNIIIHVMQKQTQWQQTIYYYMAPDPELWDRLVSTSNS